MKFHDHLLRAHSYWKALLHPTDIAIDATCGNGHDTAILAALLPQGHIYALDIQPKALANAQQRVLGPITWILGSHARLPDVRPCLIVYNLGYLPGGDKTLTTQTDTTLQSLSHALQILQPGGALSIMCYPGHPEGAKEEQAILAWATTLPHITCCHHRWINRPQSPSLLWIQT